MFSNTYDDDNINNTINALVAGVRNVGTTV